MSQCNSQGIQHICAQKTKKMQKNAKSTRNGKFLRFLRNKKKENSLSIQKEFINLHQNTRELYKSRDVNTETTNESSEYDEHNIPLRLRGNFIYKLK